MSSPGDGKKFDHTHVFKRWCFTIGTELLPKCNLVMMTASDSGGPVIRMNQKQEKFDALAYQLERGAVKRNLHLQGYFELVKGLSAVVIKRDRWLTQIFGPCVKDMHIGPAEKGREANLNYCKKKMNSDGSPSKDASDDQTHFVFVRTGDDTVRDGAGGEETGQEHEKSKGEKKAIEGAERSIFTLNVLSDEGIRDSWDILRLCRRGFESTTDPARMKMFTALQTKAITCQRQFDTLIEKRNERLAYQRYGNKVRGIEVRVFTGLPGRGKSTAARARYGGYEPYCITLGNGGFFCNYKYQPVLVIDEFGNCVDVPREVTPSMILTWLCGDPCKLKRKHVGEILAAWHLVVIISMYPFDEWFGGWKGRFGGAFKAAMASRINNKIEVFNGDEDLRARIINDFTMPLKSVEIHKTTYDSARQINAANDEMPEFNINAYFTSKKADVAAPTETAAATETNKRQREEVDCLSGAEKTILQELLSASVCDDTEDENQAALESDAAKENLCYMFVACRIANEIWPEKYSLQVNDLRSRAREFGFKPRSQEDLCETLGLMGIDVYWIGERNELMCEGQEIEGKRVVARDVTSLPDAEESGKKFVIGGAWRGVRTDVGGHSGHYNVSMNPSECVVGVYR